MSETAERLPDRLSPRIQGNVSEAKVLAALTAAGQTVLIPWGGGERYDFVVDRGGGQFYRVQIKTGRIREGSITFNTCSNQAHRGAGRVSYVGQIEAFAVYCPDNDKAYLVPIADVSTAIRHIWWNPPTVNDMMNPTYVVETTVGGG